MNFFFLLRKTGFQLYFDISNYKILIEGLIYNIIEFKFNIKKYILKS